MSCISECGVKDLFPFLKSVMTFGEWVFYGDSCTGLLRRVGSDFDTRRWCRSAGRLILRRRSIIVTRLPEKASGKSQGRSFFSSC